MSQHPLQKHEISREYFSKVKLANTPGIRNWFRDEEIKAHGGVMKPEEAIQLGYVRVIDSWRTAYFMKLNITLINHAFSELRPDKVVFQMKTALLGNLAFLIRIIMYHAFIVSLSNAPGILIVSLILLESSYILVIVKNFLAVKHLVSAHFFLGKLVQSIFLLLFHFISLLIFFQNGPTSKKQPSKSLQTISLWCLVASIILEYLFLVINIFWTVKTLIQSRKQISRKTHNYGKKENPLIVYKWVRQKQYLKDKEIIHKNPFAESENHKQGVKSTRKKRSKNEKKNPVSPPELTPNSSRAVNRVLKPDSNPG